MKLPENEKKNSNTEFQTKPRVIYEGKILKQLKFQNENIVAFIMSIIIMKFKFGIKYQKLLFP